MGKTQMRLAWHAKLCCCSCDHLKSEDHLYVICNLRFSTGSVMTQLQIEYPWFCIFQMRPQAAEA